MDHLTSSTAERWKELWQPDTKFGPDSSWIQKSFCCYIIPLCRLCNTVFVTVMNVMYVINQIHFQ